MRVFTMNAHQLEKLYKDHYSYDLTDYDAEDWAYQYGELHGFQVTSIKYNKDGSFKAVVYVHTGSIR